MLAVVSIDEDGAVQVQVDSNDDMDDDTSKLAGLLLDDLLDRASKTAIETWFAVRAPAVEAGE